MPLALLPDYASSSDDDDGGGDDGGNVGETCGADTRRTQHAAAQKRAPVTFHVSALSKPSSSSSSSSSTGKHKRSKKRQSGRTHTYEPPLAIGASQSRCTLLDALPPPKAAPAPHPEPSKWTTALMVPRSIALSKPKPSPTEPAKSATATATATATAAASSSSMLPETSLLPIAGIFSVAPPNAAPADVAADHYDAADIDDMHDKDNCDGPQQPNDSARSQRRRFGALSAAPRVTERQLRDAGIAVRDINVRRVLDNQDISKVAQSAAALGNTPIRQHLPASAKLSIVSLARKAVTQSDELEHMFAQQRAKQRSAAARYGF